MCWIKLFVFVYIVNPKIVKLPGFQVKVCLHKKSEKLKLLVISYEIYETRLWSFHIKFMKPSVWFGLISVLRPFNTF